MTDAPAKAPRRDYLDPARAAMAAKALVDSLGDAAQNDDELKLDMIEGETNLLEVIDAVLLRMAETRAMEVGLEKIIAEFGGRKKRLTDRWEFDKALIEQAMMIAEVFKIERPLATLSLAKRKPKVIVTDEAAIPSQFWAAGDPKLDKKALNEAALADGAETIPGVEISNGAPTLSIRSA